jgi:hypothetical protein
MFNRMPVYRAVARARIDRMKRLLGHAVVIGQNQPSSKRKNPFKRRRKCFLLLLGKLNGKGILVRSRT